MSPDPTKEIVIGEWYFSAECPHCHVAVPLFHDKSKGKIKIAGPDAQFQVTCKKCGREGLVSAESVVSVEATKKP